MKKLLVHPLAENLNINSPDATSVHFQIIRSKPFLKHLYREWYQSIVASLPDQPDGPILELGSGGGFLHEYIPNLITSEIQLNQKASIVLDGRTLPFAASSLQAIVMVDVFHHIPDVQSFLREAARCLRTEGRIIMVEPWISLWSQIPYKYFHHEPYMPDTQNWSFPESGPLAGANLALPWIVFQRDRKNFQDSFNDLSIIEINLDWPFLYLLSGGVSLRTLVPNWSYSFFRQIELMLSPIMKWLAMFATIVLEKQTDEQKSQ